MARRRSRVGSTLTATDLFCGAGGSSLGVVQAGVELRMAANHWDLAVETHSAAFPDADHDCADISQTEPRRYPRTDILLASPECFPAGTLILAERGLVPIEDVQVGDRVLTHRCRWRYVTSTMSRLAERTVVVRGQGHPGLEVTPEHPIAARAQRHVGKRGQKEILGAEWVAAERLGNPPPQVTRKDGAAWRWATPVTADPLKVPLVGGRGMELTPEFWWLVGRWLGDGTVRLRPYQGGEVTIVAGDHEVDELHERLGRWAPGSERRAGYGELRWRKRRVRTAWLLETGHEGLAEWLTEHFGRLAHGKQIPAWALTMEPEWRRALLDGYLSADGHVGRDGRRVQASTVSKALAIGVRLLAESLGHRCSLTVRPQHSRTIEGRAISGRDVWTVAWEQNGSQRAAFQDGLNAWSLVKEVRPGRELVEVFNLSVEEDESYVADGIVVHNCTYHSQARSNKQATYATLFNPDGDPRAERSRATMWDVIRFTEVHGYELVIVENVVEIGKWSPFQAWLLAMDSLGYDHEVVNLNSMVAAPAPDARRAPQSRDRVYVVFWKKGNRAPDLDIRPSSWCVRCDTVVEAYQSWKRTDRARIGKYRQQYIYRCPTCSEEAYPLVAPAATAIDWSLPCPRVGDRARPLAKATRRRIAIGLEMFAGPLIAQASGQTFERASSGYARVWPALGRPMPTQTTDLQHGVVIPMHQGEAKYRAHPISAPLGAITAQDSHSLVVPFIAELRGGGSKEKVRSILESLATVTASGNHHGLVVPPSFFIKNYGDARQAESMAKPITDPLGSITGVDSTALVSVPFISTYHGRGENTAVDEPLGTQTTRDRHALVEPAAMVDDCGFRMLEPHEVGRAMAFPDGYPVRGTKRDKVKLYGNAVTPPAMTTVSQRGLASVA